MSNLPDWVTVERYAGNAPGYWKIIDTNYDDSGGDVNVYAFTFDEKGQPALNSIAIQKNGGSTQLKFELNALGQAQASFNQTGDSSFDPGKGEVGPYSIAMFGASDVMHGMGLPLKRHVSYRATFQWTLTTAPPSGGGIDEATARAIVRDELRKLIAAAGSALQ